MASFMLFYALFHSNVIASIHNSSDNIKTYH